MTDDEHMAIHRGSGCFLTDQGYPNVAEVRVKALLANRVCLILEVRGWSHVAAAEATGLDAEVFVNAERGRCGVGDLIEALARLGADIAITVGEAVEGERGVALVRGVDDDD
mgnify:CR=1 FL=1